MCVRVFGLVFDLFIEFAGFVNFARTFYDKKVICLTVCRLKNCVKVVTVIDGGRKESKGSFH